MAWAAGVRVWRGVTIVWVKVPTAATSVVCSAGLVAALALPAAMQEAPEVAKDLGVKLSVNWGALDAFSAIPSLELLLSGDLSGLDGLDSTNGILPLLNGDLSALDSTNGIPAYVEFLQTGNLDAFRTTVDPPHRGVDLLSALPEYRDVFSSDPTVRDAAFGRLASLSAVPAYEKIASGDVVGGLGGIAATDAVPAYAAALSGDPSKLTNLATLDGIPALTGALSGDLTALRGYAALSAIPEYLAPAPAAAATLSAQDPAPAAKAPQTPVANLVNQVVGSIKSALPGSGKQSAPDPTAATDPDHSRGGDRQWPTRARRTPRYPTAATGTSESSPPRCSVTRPSCSAAATTAKRACAATASSSRSSASEAAIPVRAPGLVTAAAAPASS